MFRYWTIILDLDMKLPKLACLANILLRVMSLALELSCWNFLVDGNHLIGERLIYLLTWLLLHLNWFQHKWTHAKLLKRTFCSSRPRSEQGLVRWATPQLHDIDALAKMVDPALEGLYPVKSLSRFADVIALCVQVMSVLFHRKSCYLNS